MTDDAAFPFRIGNAAGEAHPLAGEGISMALQSAAILADVLIAHAGALDDWRVQQRMREEYARRWRRHFVRRIRCASLFAHAAMRPGLYRPFLPFLQRHPMVLNVFALWCDKTRAPPALPHLAPAGTGSGASGRLAATQMKEQA